ncbi:methylmalonyl-CoA mutase [Arenibacter nanhaiticus]|uniref:Methylmalonyl-CoA mutase n=1 Tax=Arenibacter nanhaiticus TaxID=558155 RepID=A0A1M6J498_9FLAO|nr:methylmalonyl-CoA mutase subunit beta [Arenibacter nanhaiticus]SHJ41489.1 methylmalonyl-CoA mutase [Arenibacter nanhaiticus]
MDKPDLFSDFSETSSKAWKQKIQVDLKGADYNETLVWESPEGIKVKPFYNSEDLIDLPLNSFPQESKWRICQKIFAGNAIVANDKALDAISRGAESIYFTVPSPETEIQELLKGIDLRTTPIYFNLQFLSENYTKSILEFSKNKSAKIFLNIDIIGHLARQGNWFVNLKEDHQNLDAIVSLGHATTLGVDMALYQNAGANITQQLAYALAHANEYLNHLNNTLEAGMQQHTITFIVAVGSDYFFEIAKLRALRRLFASLATEYGANPNCHIIGMPSKRNKTIYDYNTNLLRTTTECMSAILGEANTICNTPYDAIYHRDNEFAERMARNQLLILKNESYFDKVNNPSAGSYYIETLTHQLASKALELFKLIEKGGGFLVQLKEHQIQKKIKESAGKEEQLFNYKEKILVGTNKYRSKEDTMKDMLELYPFVKTKARKTLIEPIIEKRLSETLEQNRLKQEQP